MTRKSVEDPGEPPGTVLSAATSVWVAEAAERVFEFLRDERLRSEWDILSNGGPMQEMLHIPKSQHHHHPNAVSLLRATVLSLSTLFKFQLIHFFFHIFQTLIYFF